MAFERQKPYGFADRAIDRGVHVVRPDAIEAAEKSRDELMLQVGEQHAQRAEEPRHRRNDDAPDLQAFRQIDRVHAAVAADGEQAEAGGIAAALGSDRLQRAQHGGVRDEMNAVRGVGKRQVELRAQRADSGLGPRVIQLEIAPHERARDSGSRARGSRR
jgi:hypothetical protein